MIHQKYGSNMWDGMLMHINNFLTSGTAQEFQLCSREDRTHFCTSKLKQMNLLLLLDTLLDKCASVSIPLEWTHEWICIRDCDLERDAELRDLVMRAFDKQEINAFVTSLRMAAAQLFPPLQEAWLPIYEEQSILLYNKWQASQVCNMINNTKERCAVDQQHMLYHHFEEINNSPVHKVLLIPRLSPGEIF
jgi:hypothetical protein